MKLFFLVLITVSALLIVGGVLVLSLGRRDRRRRLAAQKPPKATPAVMENDSTISLNLADDQADQSTEKPTAMTNPAAALEIGRAHV